MTLIIENSDQLALEEEEQRKLEEFLRGVLDENALDDGFKSYLLNFVSRDGADIHLDVSEVYSGSLFQDRFDEYKDQLRIQEADTDLLENFGNFTGFDSIDDYETDLVSPVEVDQSAPVSPFDVEIDDPALSQEHSPVVEAWDGALPESKIEVPEVFSADTIEPQNDMIYPGVSDLEDQQVEGQADVVEAVEVSESDAVEEESETIDLGESDPDVEKGRDQYLEDLERLRALSAITGQMQGGVAPGTETDDKNYLVEGVKEIAKGAGALIGSAFGVAGAGLEGGVKGFQAGRDKTSQLALELAAKSRGWITGEKIDVSPSDMAQLRGEEENSNVVDIRSRMKQAVASYTPENIGENVAMIRAAGLEDKRNALVSTMQGIESGLPGGRYSAMSVMPGVSLGAALSAAQSSDSAISAMAKANLLGMTELNAINEMEFKACEYQEIHDTLSSLVEQAQAQGMSQEDIQEQFAKPVESWMEKFEEEDKILSQLADVQNTGENALSEEELQERKDAIERMAEKIREMIDKLMGRNQGQDQTATVSR